MIIAFRKLKAILLSRDLMKKPMIFYTLGIIIGILLVGVEINIFLIGVLVLTILPIAFLLEEKKVFIFLTLIFIAFLRMKGVEESYLKEYDQKNIRYLAVVEDTNYKSSQKIRILRINGNKVNENSLFYTEENLEIGDIVTGMAFFSLPQEKMNPSDFNQKTYLGRQGIYSTLRTKSSIEIIGKDSSLMLKVKRSILNYLKNTPLKGQNKELILRIFTGRSELDENLEDSIKSLGLSHIIAISGLHIGLFILIALFFTRWIHRKILFPLVLIIISIYAYAIGFPPSIQRALLFTFLLYLCEAFHWPHDEVNILWMTLCIILLLNPYELYSPGLQFSFLATYVILKNQKMKKEENLLDILKISILISLFLLPIQLYYFNEFHLGFLIGNIFIVPLFTFIISGSFMGYLFFPLKSTLFRLLNPFINFLWLVLYGGNILSKTIKVRSFTGFEIFIFYLCIYLYQKRTSFHLLTNKNRIHLLKIYGVTVFILITYLLVLDPLSVKILYMGQENSHLIEYKNSKILYDVGGNFYSTENNRLKKYLEYRGISQIDGVILSHFHFDHAGNLSSINDKIKYILSRPNGKEDLENIIGSLEKDYLEIFNKTKLKNGDLDFTFYYNEKGNSENNLSLVLQLNHFNTKIFLTGDIEKETEKFLEGEEISSTILLVPHHGSNTSSTDEFLDSVKPKLAIISCGINNRFGFPHEEVLERYKSRGIPVIQTNEEGMIEIISHRFGWKVKTRKEDSTENIFLLLIYIYFISYLAILEKENENELL